MTAKKKTEQPDVVEDQAASAEVVELESEPGEATNAETGETTPADEDAAPLPDDDELTAWIAPGVRDAITGAGIDLDAVRRYTIHDGSVGVAYRLSGTLVGRMVPLTDEQRTAALGVLDVDDDAGSVEVIG